MHPWAGSRRSRRVACATGDCGRRPNSRRTAGSGARDPTGGAAASWRRTCAQQAVAGASGPAYRSEVTPARGAVWVKAPRRHDATLHPWAARQGARPAGRPRAMRGHLGARGPPRGSDMGERGRLAAWNPPASGSWEQGARPLGRTRGVFAGRAWRAWRPSATPTRRWRGAARKPMGYRRNVASHGTRTSSPARTWRPCARWMRRGGGLSAEARPHGLRGGGRAQRDRAVRWTGPGAGALGQQRGLGRPVGRRNCLRPRVAPRGRRMGPLRASGRTRIRGACCPPAPGAGAGRHLPTDRPLRRAGARAGSATRHRDVGRVAGFPGRSAPRSALPRQRHGEAGEALALPQLGDVQDLTEVLAVVADGGE